MKVATTKEEVLDEILLGLADNFEAGNPHVREFAPSCREEFEPLRECLAEMIAEGWLMQLHPAKLYCLTPAGLPQFQNAD